MKEMLDINMKLKAEISKLQNNFEIHTKDYEKELKDKN